MPAPPDGHAPAWVQAMQAPAVDVFQLDTWVSEWQQSAPAGGETWLRFYRKWRRAVTPWLDAQGVFQAPPADALTLRQEERTIRRAAPGRNGLADWTCLGPFETYNDAIDGTQVPVSWQANVYCLAQSLSHPEVLYCGTEGAEVYRSEDRGQSWQPASRSLAVGAVSAIAVHPTNPDDVLAGDGQGVYRSLDGGKQWTTLLQVSQLQVHTLAIHPVQTQWLFAAGEKGLWRSADGGQQWMNVFPEACFDLAFHPTQPDIVYVLRDDPADRRCTFWKSTDGGQTFIQKPDGWFNGMDADRFNGGARMTVTPADPDRVYVVLIGQAKAGDNGFIGVYRSHTAGESWVLPNPPAGGPYSPSHPNLAVINPFSGTGFHQGFYNLGIAASHTHPDHLLIGHLNLWRSTDGAATFELLGGYGGSLPWIHPDVQDIQVLGQDAWVCTDGGINYSTDFFQTHESRKRGITGSDYWGFAQGWNDDILVGGRYHNGNSGWFETYPQGVHLRLGGGEAPTGYVRPGPDRHTYFSDIGGKVLPPEIDKPSRAFPVSRWPNELYFPGESSEQVWMPDCYNHYIIGEGNGLWKTEDGGSAFSLIRAFDQPGGGRLTQIALCREQPQVLYVAQRNSASWNEGWIWKTTDGGATWIALPLPPGYKRRFTLTVDAVDPDRVWLGYTDGANGQKVYASTDGGLTWANLTTPILDNEAPHSLVHIAGTNGSLLLATSESVYYRQGPDGEWVWFGDGLPEVIFGNVLRPFYRDGKIRLGAYGKGIWESPLPESFTPVIQPTVDKRVAGCVRDTFWFDDHSVLLHEGVTWSWTFPGGEPANAAERSPRVVYSAPGWYEATLTVEGSFGSLSKSMEVEVRNECDPDTVAGMALRLSDEGDVAVVRNGDDQVYTELTLSAWVKPEGVQADYTGIMIGTFAGNAFGINVRDDNRLGYHWPGGAWWWDSGFTLKAGEWQHVALVMRPGSITLYHNGIGKTHQTNVQPVALHDLNIGRYRDWNERTWDGWLDEAAIWGRALSQEEIRERMHLTRTIEADSGLLAYWQFNRLEGQETDRVGVRHLSFAGGAQRVRSTAPVGSGVSARQPAVGAGTVSFGETGVRMVWPEGGFNPDGEIVVSRIYPGPDERPDSSQLSLPHYWIARNYGNGLHDPLTLLEIDPAGPVSEANQLDPATLTLHYRAWNGEGPEWSALAGGSQATAGMAGAVQFEGVPFLGQWAVTNMAGPTRVVDPIGVGRSLEQAVVVYPNPVAAGGQVTLMTTWAGEGKLRLLDPAGRTIWTGVVRDGQTVPIGEWSPGQYFYDLQIAGQKWRGSLRVE